MARHLIVVVCLAMGAAATLLHGSEAQTTHVVGDALGWLVPPGGDTAYTTWASLKTFTVGDILVFNYATGFHNVAEVTKEAFNSCNTSSPISLSTNGPTNITLRSPGEHYFLCTFSRHSGLGQKLAINVSAASSSSPAPQPTTALPPPAAPSGMPAPAPPPAPSPSGTRTYIVGDSLGWNVPPGGAIAYQTWATDKNFMIGDVLVFNFAKGAQNVAEVTKTAYDSCNTSSPKTTITESPARITLSKAGEHYFICTFQGHCSLGQKLAINVSATAAAPPPSSSVGGAAPPTTTNPSAPAQASPPGNSAPVFAAAAALPLTFFSIALALFYSIKS